MLPHVFISTVSLLLLFIRSVVSNSLLPYGLYVAWGAGLVERTKLAAVSWCWHWPILVYGYFCCCCSVAKSCNPMDCSTPGFPVLHYLLEFAQTRVHRVGDAIQPSHPVSPPSPPVFNLSQHQGLFQWVSSLHQVAKVLELQHQYFQQIFRVNFH